MSSALNWAESLIREAQRVVARYTPEQRKQRAEQINAFNTWLDSVDPQTGRKRILRWDTKTNNSAKSGAYHRARHQAQIKVIQDLMEDQGYDAKEAGKWAFIVAGMTASGKTTALRQILAPDKSGKSVYDRAVGSDPDEAKQKIWEHGLGPDPEEIRQAYLQDTGVDLGPLTPGELASTVHEESSDIAKMLTQQAIRDGKPILMDNTLTKPGAGAKRVKKVRDIGYQLGGTALVDIPTAASVDFAEDRYTNGRERWDEAGSTLPPRTPDVSPRAYRMGLPREQQAVYDSQYSRAVPRGYIQSSQPRTPGHLSMASEVWANEVEPYALSSHHITPGVTRAPDGRHQRQGHPRVQARTAPGPQAIWGEMGKPAPPPYMVAQRRTAMDQPPQDIREAFEAFEGGQLTYDDLLYAVSVLPPPEWESEGTRDDYPDVYSYVEMNPFSRPDADGDILHLVLSGAIDIDQAGDLYDAVYSNPNADMDPDAELGF